MFSRAGRFRKAVLATLIGALSIMLALSATPAGNHATAATGTKADKSQLRASIDSLSPSHLTEGDTIELSGTVTNNSDEDWDKLQAYLVISKSPFTSYSQLRSSVVDDKSYAGDRIVDLSTIDELGTLKAGKTKSFEIKVPWKKLRLTGADGVYPVGVQFLGTDSNGHRSNKAIGRATTFLPKLDDDESENVTMSMLWPFRLADHRNSDGNWDSPKEQLKQIRPGGRLATLLRLAEDQPSRSTVLLDPALLAALDDIAHKRNLPEDSGIDSDDAKRAKKFRESLVKLARNSSLWIVGYDRPDIQAIADDRRLTGHLMDLIDDTTTAVLDKFGLSGRRVSWPEDGSLTRSAAQTARGPGDQPVIVSSEHVKDWAPRSGSVVRASTNEGPVPLVIDDGLLNQVPGDDSVIALRQWMGAQSALAQMQHAIDPDSKTDVVAVVPPTWQPTGSGTSGDLQQAFELPWIDGVTLDEILQAGSLNEVSLPTKAAGNPLSGSLLKSAYEVSNKVRQLGELTGEHEQSDSTKPAMAPDSSLLAASALSSRWRSKQAAAAEMIDAAHDRISDQFDKISIEGPASVTLSSDQGQFPLTIRNDTSEPITVGLNLEASNPAITAPHVKTIEIDAGQRHTYTVDLDLGAQSSTSVTAHLTTDSGKTFGDPVVFNVRASNVSSIVWVTLAAAGVLVVFAMARRFRRQESQS